MLSATFGNIDLVTLAQSDLMNWDGNTNSGTVPSSGNTSSSSSTAQPQQHRNVRELLNYASAAAAASGLSSGNKNSGMDSSGNCSSGSTKTSVQSFSEAEMKALMDMFVQIMGISMDSPNGNSSTNGEGGSDSNSTSNSNNKTSSNSKASSSKGGAGGNSSSATVSFARESLSRMNMAAAAAAAAANNSSRGGGTSSTSSNGSNPFPVFSMMFGGQGNNNGPNSNSNNEGNSTMPSGNGGMISPPPGGWPPGAAAAAAAAVAAATSSGGLSSASLSVPMQLGLPYPHGFGPGTYGDAAEWLQDEIHGNFDPEDDDDDDEEEEGLLSDRDKVGDDVNDEDEDESDDLPDLIFDPVDQEEELPSSVGGAACDGTANHAVPQDRVSGLVATLKNRQQRINAMLSSVADDPVQQSSSSSSFNNAKSKNKNNVNNKSKCDNKREITVTEESFMEKYLQNHPSSTAAAELLREEEEAAAACMDNEEEERARRAAKKREKKNRKKEKAKREAAIKAAQAAQKRREKTINSWRSRVVTACSGGELGKLDALLSENPLKENGRNNNHHSQNFDPDILREAGGRHVSPEEEINQNMEWLLPSCIAKVVGGGRVQNNQNVVSIGQKARIKLGMFVMRMAFHVVFITGKSGRTALHIAAFAGDASFVQLVVAQNRRIGESDEKVNENDNKDRGDRRKIPKRCLDVLCDDLGWSPLHFAVVGGWIDVVEELLAGGCNIHRCTEPTLTCRKSNGKGVTARELIEIIRGEKHVTSLECKGDGLYEVIENSSSGGTEDRKKYKTALEQLSSRLSDVEKHGYTPLDRSKKSSRTENKSNSVKSAQETNKVIMSSSATSTSNQDNSKSKKKKKKKKKNAASEVIDETKSNVSNSPAIQEDAVDPLVLAMLAMGFTDEQIHAALDACGGTDRATADDLVSWILENQGCGESSSVRQTDSRLSEDDSNSRSKPNIIPNLSITPVNTIQHLQHRVSQAQKEAAEAAMRETEAKAAAERLAAKREEQRRIRMEWNNREQQRQKENAKAKLAEEVERSRRLEIERSKALAQRVAKQRAAMLLQQDPTLAQSQLSVHEGPISVAGNNNVGSTPLFSSTLYPGSTPGVSHHVEPYPASDIRSNAVSTQIPPYQHHMMGMNPPFAQVPTYNNEPDAEGVETTSGRYGPSYDSSPAIPIEEMDRGVENVSKHSPQAELNVNGFDFPELGKEKGTPPSTPEKSGSKSNEILISQETLSPGGVSMQKSTQSISILDSTPGKFMGQSHSSSKMLYPQSTPPFDSNPLGEIRATAREFVPTTFTPGSITADNGISNTTHFAASMSSQPVPPGLSVVSTGSNNGDPESSLLQSCGGSLMPLESASKVNSLLPPQSSILPPHTTSAFDPTSMASPYQISNTVLDKPITNSATHSPVPSTTSSITGFSASVGDENFVQRIESTMSYENNHVEGNTRTPSFLEPSLLGASPSLPLAGTGLPGSTLANSSDTAATSGLTGSNIWGGGGGGSSASNFGSFSGFNFAEKSNSDIGAFQTSIGAATLGSNKKENKPSDTWTSCVPPNIGKSIW